MHKETPHAIKLLAQWKQSHKNKAVLWYI